MKEIKRTPVPLPVPRTKPKQNDTLAKTQLSQEVIYSDDDDSSRSSSPKAKTSSKPKTTIAIHTPVGAVKRPKEKSKEKSGTKAKASQPKTTPKAPEPEPVAISSSSEQSDDSDTSEETTKKNGTERKRSTSDSDSDSDMDSSDESVAGTDSQAARTPAREKDSRKSQTQSHAVKFQSAQPYVPPKGFHSVPISAQTASKAASLFSDLGSKQIWHITAPTSVSLKDLKKLAMDKALDGQAVLTHKGTGYGLSQTEESENCTREIIVPGRSGYEAVPARISHTLHLQAVVQLPELSSKQADPNTGSEAAASITRSTIRAPRAQVTGLKMRFLPSGSGDDAAGTIGESDDEMGAPTGTAGLGVPNGLNLPTRRKEKRKHADLNGTESLEAPAKKSKQQHRSAEDVKRKEERRAKKEKRRAQEASSSKP